MLSEWSVECSADDPVLVVPWSDPSDSTGNRRFIDLRENPYDLDHLPEAEHYPPLMHALRALNAARSPVFTAKCDAWPLDAEELDELRVNLDISADESCGRIRQLHRHPVARALASSPRFTCRNRCCTDSPGTLLLWNTPTHCSTASFVRRWST